MVMKIFFAGSIRGGGNYQGMYREILGFLKTYGDILSEHQEYDSAPDNQGLTGDAAIYARDTGWIRDADVLIAEVSQPSCGVGYEIAYAESRGIPVLALYYRGATHPISAMIAGNRSITTIIYDSIDHLISLLRNELDP
ncbi:MAG: nucleoside 2-deoxyribosyltransferase superfamily protein [Geobacteraceae bacterium]|nr:nucleoside 2-deoxyribosyltransferase superfamily protein [Geobacteraceae bacterium]